MTRSGEGTSNGQGLIDEIGCRCYSVPTDQPEADGTLSWSETSVVVVTARSGDTSGLGWTYASGACCPVVEEKLSAAVVGGDAMAVGAANEAMVRACRNLGRPGLAAEAISAVDVALWDLKARLLGVDLASLLGRHRNRVPFYGSGGFTTYDDPTTRRQVEDWVGRLGCRSIKIKIGEDWGRCTERDAARVALCRATAGDGVDVMVDANGAYRRKQAVRVGERLWSESGVVWFEEPVSSDDLAGLVEVRDRVSADVTAGEYGYTPSYFAGMVSAGAVDCLQVDATRCGGYTGWLAAAALAAAHNLDVSAHCAPNLHAPVAAAIANLRHVEYFHDHARLDPLLFDGLPATDGGRLVLGSGPGHGIVLKEDEAERYRQR